MDLFQLLFFVLASISRLKYQIYGISGCCRLLFTIACLNFRYSENINSVIVRAVFRFVLCRYKTILCIIRFSSIIIIIIVTAITIIITGNTIFVNNQFVSAESSCVLSGVNRLNNVARIFFRHLLLPKFLGVGLYMTSRHARLKFIF